MITDRYRQADLDKYLDDAYHYERFLSNLN